MVEQSMELFLILAFFVSEFVFVFLSYFLMMVICFAAVYFVTKTKALDKFSDSYMVRLWVVNRVMVSVLLPCFISIF